MEMPCSAHIEPEEAPTRSDERDDNGQIQDVCALSEWEDTIDNDGNTCLHLMARQKMLNKVKLAPEGKVWNALVNHKNKDGHTPLHISCIKRDRASARILLDNGADINATDMLGLTPLHRAIIAQGAFEDGTEVTTKEKSVIELLLEVRKEKKLNIHVKSYHQGATPLHLAAVWALTDVVELLIKEGADKHLTTWRGETVLHWAFKTMRDDEENYPEWMIRDRRRDKLGRTGDGGLDEDLEATSNIKIARYGVDMMSALVSTDEQETWEELLRIAAQEDDESMVRYSAQRLFPFAPKKEIELVKVWLAMRPERFERLKMELLQHVNQAERAAWNCRNVLELAAHLDLPEFVRWLLRSYGWSRKQRKDAKGLVPELNTTSKWTSVWEVPFLHVARKGVRNTGYRNPCEVDSSIAMFQSSIMNFYNSGTYTHFLHHLCGVHDLLYNGKKGPVRIMKGVAKTFRDTFPELNTDTYDDSHLKYRWIHLPANCMDWMNIATTSSYRDKDNNLDYFTALSQFLLQSWHELPDTSSKDIHANLDSSGKDKHTNQEHSHYDKYMNPTCLRKDAPSGNGTESPRQGDKASGQLALYMPYITFSRPTYKPNEGTVYPEREMILRENTHLLHGLKTLDTYHLGTTDNEKARDRDCEQVVFRHAKRKIGDYEKLNPKMSVDHAEIPVLHVGQLWLWVIDEDTVVTSETHNIHDDSSPILENVLSYLNDDKVNLGQTIVPKSLNAFVKYITSSYINTPFDLTTPMFGNDEKEESLHDIFLSSIERVNSKEDELRKKFENEMHNQDKGKKIDGEGNLHISVTETVELLSEIKDIQQELNIISSVILIQNNVLGQLTNCLQAPDRLTGASYDNENMNWARGTEPAQYVLRRIKDLSRFAEETQNNVDSILQLKMNQLSLLQAEEAGRQGKILMVFTVVTVVFTPLSFLSALFALNVSVFPHSGTDLLYEPGWLFGILIGFTVGVAALGWAWIRFNKQIKSGYKSLSQVWTRKEPSEKSDVTDHGGLRRNQSQDRPPQRRYKNRVSGVWDMVQQLRERRREILPTIKNLPDK